MRSSHFYEEMELDTGEQHLVRLIINLFLAALPASRFVRIHRSHIVNLSYIERFEGQSLKLSGRTIPASNWQRRQLLERLPDLGA